MVDRKIERVRDKVILGRRRKRKRKNKRKMSYLILI
jgi:hypothetical protein